MKFPQLCLTLALAVIAFSVRGSLASEKNRLPDIDRRQPLAASNYGGEGVAHLRELLPNAEVGFDPITGTPRSIKAQGGFLSATNGQGRAISAKTAASFAKNDPYAPTKAFLKEHSKLFGHGPEALETARIKREFVTPHNGMRSVVWEQQVDGIAVFEGVLVSHTTKKGELVNLSSRFLSNPGLARTLGTPQAAALVKQPSMSAPQALAKAAGDVGETLNVADIALLGSQTNDPEQHLRFAAPALVGEAYASLTWLPLNSKSLRLCWNVLFMSRQRREMFQTLVDARTGEIHLRRNLTFHISDASYRVFTSDSPTPFSPGHAVPLTNQPPLADRVLVTTPALDTNASPNGWIDDGVNETRGNNVDAHLDRDWNDAPDLPRPQGSPYRVFDFPLDLSQSPTTYSQASVVQLFYWCNWYHDKLYELGFTEAAGNFQNDNFNRGGVGGDAVQADAQDGSDSNNADFSVLPDGLAPRMQMYLFTGPTPWRDASLDAEIIFHEYTHGLSNRRVGGGIGLYAMQALGMGEGWSDFYALSMLSESGDDPDGNYAMAAYSAYDLSWSYLNQNYYYGLRRYPYTTDMTKNPLTFKDIDPWQASRHAGIPFNPSLSNDASQADEYHNQGEVWCSMLWEIRAAMIKKQGWPQGNQITLQLVTDAMNLTPPDPNFIEARDAILAADLVNNGGTNRALLWAAFAKRGLGYFASSPASDTCYGVVESFGEADDLAISTEAAYSKGPVGGPFSQPLQKWTLSNSGTNLLPWTVSATASWLTLSQTSGSLSNIQGAATFAACLNQNAHALPAGIYTNYVRFTNLVTGNCQTREFKLCVGQREYFAELFDRNANDLAFQSFLFTPNGSASFYAVCREPISAFPTDPTGGTAVNLPDDGYASVTLSNSKKVSLYGISSGTFYIGGNGYVTFLAGDQSNWLSYDDHFTYPRVSAFLNDFDPSTGGTISWKQLDDRVAITWFNLPQYSKQDSSNFQIELFFDGRIRVSYLHMDAMRGIAGLSEGNGTPYDFTPSDLSGFGSCTIQDEDRPFLNVNVIPDSLVFNWPASLDCVLESTETLSPANWLPVTNQLSLSGETLYITNRPAPGMRFFRLRK